VATRRPPLPLRPQPARPPPPPPAPPPPPPHKNGSVARRRSTWPGAAASGAGRAARRRGRYPATATPRAWRYASSWPASCVLTLRYLLRDGARGAGRHITPPHTGQGAGASALGAEAWYQGKGYGIVENTKV